MIVLDQQPALTVWLTAAVFAAWAAMIGVLLLGWRRFADSRQWRAAGLVTAMLVALVHQMLFFTVTEDAFISYRYAVNLAEGNGLVFNPGERVEGYSNLLWTLVLAIPQALAGRGVMTFSIALGMACTLGCVALAYLVANRIVAAARTTAARTDPRPGLVAAALTAVSGSLAAYGPSGLETSLFTLLVFATCHAVIRRHHFLSGVLVTLTTMTRPDGAVVAIAVLAWLILSVVRGRSGFHPVVVYSAGVFVLAVPWTAWRLVYYGGYLLPNTIAAKSGGALGWQLTEGWKYLADFGLAHHGLLLIAAAGAATLSATRRSRRDVAAVQARRAVWLLFAVAVMYTAFIVVAGGDYMAAWRFFAPVPPLLATASAAAAGILVHERADRETVQASDANKPIVHAIPAVTAAICLVSLLISVMAPKMAPLIHLGGRYTAALAEIGDWFGKRLPSGTVISTVANGAISYNAGTDVVIVDALGLTDEHIGRQGTKDNPLRVAGHVSNDWEYVVDERRPSLVVVTGRGYVATQPCAIDTRYAGRFRESVENGRYRTATFRREGQQNWVVVYLRSDEFPALLSTLDADPRFAYEPCPAR